LTSIETTTAYSTTTGNEDTTIVTEFTSSTEGAKSTSIQTTTILPVTAGYNEFPIQRNNLIAKIPEWGPAWKISFELNIASFFNNGDEWGNVFHFTSTGNDCCEIGARIPALFTRYNNSLYYTKNIDANGNDYTYSNFINTNTWYSFEIKQNFVSNQLINTLKVIEYGTGTLIWSLELPNNNLQTFYNVQVYAGDNFYNPSDATIRNFQYSSLSSDQGAGLEWIKVFSHNTDGGIFSGPEDALSKNSDDPTADLYSILDQLDKYKSDKGFHFKLCYPELIGVYNGDGCNEWIQTSNPATDTTVTGFKAISLTFPYNSYMKDWDGIGKDIKKDTWLGAFIDDSPNGDYFWTSIGAYQYHGSASTIPGPKSKTEGENQFLVTKVELYVNPE